MLFSILSLISGLASLSLGSPCVTTVACSLDPLPAFSTLDKPFILRGPQNYNVFESQIHGLKDVFRLMIIQTGGPQAEFTLKDGVLQTTHGNFSAFIPAAPAIFPPKLNSVQLAKNPRLRAGFVAQHRCNQQGKRILVLTSIAERKFKLQFIEPSSISAS